MKRIENWKIKAVKAYKLYKKSGLDVDFPEFLGVEKTVIPEEINFMRRTYILKKEE